jgi:hypothetical protein
MAIIVDEEKKPTHIFAILGWLGFLVVATVAVYYIFFAAPQAAVLPTTGSLSALAPLASSTIQPQDVINEPAFQAILKGTTIQPPSPTGPASVKRANPFLSP